MGDDSWDTNDVNEFHEIDEGRDGQYEDDGRDNDDDPEPAQPQGKRQSTCPVCRERVDDLLAHLKENAETHPGWAEWLEKGTYS